jgi:hypothetical protein
MLDISKPITVPILSGTEKRVKVLFPSTEQWCERARKQTYVRHFLGRGKSQIDGDNGKTDRINADLLAKIRQDVDGGVVLTSAEATMVVGKLERARVVSADREGDGYRIVLQTALGEVTHVVRGVLADEELEHDRQSTKSIDGRRESEIRGFLEPSGELYNKIFVSANGYAPTSRGGDTAFTDIPIVHKVAVVAEVIAQKNADDEALIPEQ